MNGIFLCKELLGDSSAHRFSERAQGHRDRARERERERKLLKGVKKQFEKKADRQIEGGRKEGPERERGSKSLSQIT